MFGNDLFLLGDFYDYVFGFFIGCYVIVFIKVVCWCLVVLGDDYIVGGCFGYGVWVYYDLIGWYGVGGLLGKYFDILVGYIGGRICLVDIGILIIWCVIGIGGVFILIIVV